MARNSIGACRPHSSARLQVPLRRVNAAYVIATSTKVDVSSADVGSLSDKNFTAEKKRKAKKSQEDFFGKDEPAKKVLFCTLWLLPAPGRVLPSPARCLGASGAAAQLGLARWQPGRP